MAQTDYPAKLWSLIEEVRDWSNRSGVVLEDHNILRCLQYAADTSYRMLRIPALEKTATYTVTESDFIQDTRVQGDYVTLTIPGDLVSFIYLKTKNEGRVFNEKLDERTFFDVYACKTSFNRFTRVGNELHVAGLIADSDELQLHYYRRLPALTARYSVNANNYDTKLTYLKDTDDTGAHFLADTDYIVDGQLVRPTLLNGTRYVGKQVPNWLRDENRKCLVFGALYHAFDFLMDDAEAQRWARKFQESIEELNQEEKFRRASGGNVAMNYSSHLLSSR